MSYLRNSLPKYMIPMYYYELEGIPLNKNGKVDRKALRKKAEKALTVKKSAQVKEHDETAQSKDFKNTLADIWSEVSEAAPELSPDTRFYILGLAPNASRISIRFWLDTTFDKLAEHLAQHWQDLALEPCAWKTPPS